MNALQIINASRVLLREKTTDVESIDRFFSNTDLLQFCNDALDRISTFLEFSEQELTEDLVASTLAYTFSTSLGINKVYYLYTGETQYTELPIKTRDELDRMYGTSWMDTTQTGPLYSLVENRAGSQQVSVVYAPNTTGTLKIVTSAMIAHLSADTDVPGINEVYHPFIVNYVVAIGYSQRLQFDISDRYMGIWSTDLGNMKVSLTRQGNQHNMKMADSDTDIVQAEDYVRGTSS